MWDHPINEFICVYCMQDISWIWEWGVRVTLMWGKHFVLLQVLSYKSYILFLSSVPCDYQIYLPLYFLHRSSPTVVPVFTELFLLLLWPFQFCYFLVLECNLCILDWDALDASLLEWVLMKRLQISCGAWRGVSSNSYWQSMFNTSIKDTLFIFQSTKVL